MNFNDLVDKCEDIKRRLIDEGYSCYDYSFDPINDFKYWSFWHKDGRRRVLYLSSHYRALVLMSKLGQIILKLKADN